MGSQLERFKEKVIEFINKKKAICASVIVLCAVVVGFLAYQSTFYYQLIFNGQEIGIVQEKAIAESALKDVQNKVAKDFGNEAYFNSEVKLNKIRVQKNKLIEKDKIISSIISKIKIYKPAAIIKIDGEEKLVLNTKVEAEKILDNIKNESMVKIKAEAANYKLLDISFSQKVEVVTKDVLVDEILTSEEALDEIEGDKKRVKTYKVALGDNAWSISRAYNTGMSKLQQANAGKNIEDLMPGDTLNLVIEKTFVDVTATIKQTIKQEVAYKVEQKKDASLDKGVSKVLQKGDNGIKEVTKQMTYVNGVKDKEKVLEEKVIEEPKTKIVLVGTKQRRVYVSRGAAPTYNGNIGSAIVATAKHYLGIPYVYGGSTPSGFDCSGFTQYVFRQYGIALPRTSDGQGSVGGYVSRSGLRPGDLVVFSGHVGIYVGNNNFIHSPRPGKSVQITSLSGPYWNSHFISGRRVY